MITYFTSLQYNQILNIVYELLLLKATWRRVVNVEVLYSLLLLISGALHLHLLPAPFFILFPPGLSLPPPLVDFQLRQYVYANYSWGTANEASR